MGLIQNGSRRWLDDRGWWVCIVDFESLSYEKGTQLVVAADFLWHDRDWLGYAAGGRLRERDGSRIHLEFESESQFKPEAERLARRAGEEVLLYRARFQSLGDWAEVFAKETMPGGWRSLDAAVAYGLMGDVQAAHRWFDAYCGALEGDSDARDWEVTSVERARGLQALVDDSGLFRAAIELDVHRFRTALGLPDVPLTFE